MYILFCIHCGGHRYLHVMTSSFHTLRSSDLFGSLCVVPITMALRHEGSRSAQPHASGLCGCERCLGALADAAAFFFGEGSSEEHTFELQSLMRLSYAVFS